MTAQRNRKEEKIYHEYLRQVKLKKPADYCVFCDIPNHPDQIVKETLNFRVIKNIFPYSIWDNEKVADHLMIVPKLHTDKLGNLPKGAAEEFLKLVDMYEDQGYNLYARAPGSNIKSIHHQHSHLIKSKGSRRKFVLYLRKPTFRITF